MAIPNTYYLNGSSLGDSTAVFTDEELTILAADGWYSNGDISRQQLSGVLLPQQNCPTCGTSCGGVIDLSGSQGVYLINIDAGTDSVGAIIVKFNPYYVPDGIKATYNEVVYNKLSSPLDGLHKAASDADFTYVGETASDCGISGTTYPAVEEFLYDGSFVPTGNTQSITVSPSDVSLSADTPGECVMVIPKLYETPNIINLEIFGPCDGTSWSVSVECPVLLTGFPASTLGETVLEACGLYISQTLYLVKVSAGTTVDVHDYVFLDEYGYAQAPDGYYNIGDSTLIEVENGIVISKTNCELCISNTITTTTSGYVNYTDCLGNPQTAAVGGSVGYNEFTFCSIASGTINIFGDIVLTTNGNCLE